MKLKIILLLVFFLLVSIACEKKETLSSEEYKTLFEELNTCNLDEECIIGQVNVGTDIASPSPECVSKRVIDRFDSWFESKHKLTLKCFCNKTTSNCDGNW